MNKTLALRVAGSIFGLIAIVHFLRLMIKFEVIVANYTVPMGFSMFGLIIAGLLSVWMFVASKN
jgi:hypothetical protein